MPAKGGATEEDRTARSWIQSSSLAGVADEALARSDVLGRFDLTDRVAVVTGGSRGIGFAIARGFAAVGAKVVVASRKAEACERAVAVLREGGAEALAVPTHVGDLGQVATLVERTVEHYGALDVVVNNAANALAQPVGSITPEALEKSHATNLRGPLFLVQEALPSLRASGRGVVINVISAGVFMHSGGLSLYASAKSGLLALTRSMAAELAPDGIRVNALAPGTVDTDMVRNTDPAAQERMATVSLLRRMAAPEEMIGPAVFLASDASSYVTGQVLVADGGLTFR
jgi:NAD(P)-dependent dehydrogenase (short-subunit alcohol dehydrogenase family)